MKHLIGKIKNAIEVLEKECGHSLKICALVLREDPLEKWDIIVSEPWLNPKEMESYNIVSSKIQKQLDSSELVQFSRIVILDHNDPVVTYLRSLQTITNGGFEELKADELSERFKFNIKKAFLLRSSEV